MLAVVGSLKKGAVGLDEYWKEVVARYVAQRRYKKAQFQKENARSRKTVSDIENARTDFRLSTLLDVLDSVGGDISEAFKSHVPKSLHGEDQALHEMLQSVLETKDPQATEWAKRVIRDLYNSFVAKS